MFATPLRNHSPWLTDPSKESWLILAPSIVPVFIVLIFHRYFSTHEVSTWWWIALVLCVDVSHVYSTLFRMYWDKSTFQQHKKLLVIIPIVAFLFTITIHYFSALMFWRVLAYIAVFHFIRQQYGFMRLYSRNENNTRIVKIIDTVSIYNATMYPLLYWHFHLTNKLNWFVKGDFITLESSLFDQYLLVMFISILIAYLVKEAVVSIKSKNFNVPKNLIMIGTYASWYVGIVMFQGDLIFTLLNVVAHGIPYMGLVWIYGEKKAIGNFKFNLKGVGIFAIVLFTLAYFEESIWDIFVWKDHTDIFPWFTTLNPIQNELLLSIVVALLVLPQITHYVIDGFIWRVGSKPKAES